MKDQQLSELLMTLGHAFLNMARGLETDKQPATDREQAQQPEQQPEPAQPASAPLPDNMAFVENVRQVVQQTGGRAAPTIKALLGDYAPPGGGVSSVPAAVHQAFLAELRTKLNITEAQ